MAGRAGKTAHLCHPDKRIVRDSVIASVAISNRCAGLETRRRAEPCDNLNITFDRRASARRNPHKKVMDKPALKKILMIAIVAIVAVDIVWPRVRPYVAKIPVVGGLV